MKIPKTHSLETARFLLRIPKEADIPYIFEASRYKGFNDGLGWDPPVSIEEMSAPLERALMKWEEGMAYQFSILDKDSLQFLGRISIRITDLKEVWNVGFWTHPQHQKKGVMTEVLAEVLTFGFQVLNAKRIEAEYVIWNEASKKVLERCGMRFVQSIEKGLFKKGEWVAENQMAIDRINWGK